MLLGARDRLSLRASFPRAAQRESILSWRSAPSRSCQLDTAGM
jgi:hypothetical protein